jgi:glutathione S-transferase
MELVYIIIGLALLQFWAFGLIVGGQRVKLKVDAPATTGDPVFERYHRVHYNTMEQLVIFVPSILIYAHFISTTWAAGLGVIYLLGRIVYLLGYVADPKKRAAGFGLSWLPNTILLLGGLGGGVWKLVA